MLTLIVARDRAGAIGRGGTIPWDLPEDLAAFRRETLGGALVMGRRTWESLPVRPLARRCSIVVSRSRAAAAEGALVAASVEEALAQALAAGHHRVYGIGGAGIYAALLARADRLMISEVGLQVAGADTFFPAPDPADWRLIAERPLRSAPPDCQLREYLRRS